MQEIAPVRRPWREVAKEQRYSLRQLGTHVGRSHQTVRQYSAGYRRVPQDVLDKLSELFGVPVE